jgi:hypothetical protein
VAAAWRAGGGQVVGLLGWSAPRELVVAAGLLPVRLSPDRIARPDGARESMAPGLALAAGPRGDGSAAGFARELTPGTARLAAALLSGALDWIDFLLIGRDCEAHTRLFYVLRELRRSGAAPGLPPVAFFDLLRLPSRTSARYNRQRTAELSGVIAGWSGRPVTPAGLAGAVGAARETAHSFGRIQALRTRPQPAITGSDALTAAIAAQVLPVTQLRPLLAAALAAGPAGAVPGEAVPGEAVPAARVFLAGSAVDDLTAYEALEDLGLAVVGEDHEWGDDGSEAPAATRDPLDGIVDRYQFAHGGAARAGLRDRVGQTAARIAAAGPDGVLYLLGPHDEAAGWELALLSQRLGADTPLVPVRLRDPGPPGAEPADSERGDREPADSERGEIERGDIERGDSAHGELREAGRRLLGALGVAGGARAASRG